MATPPPPPQASPIPPQLPPAPTHPSNLPPPSLNPSAPPSASSSATSPLPLEAAQNLMTSAGPTAQAPVPSPSAVPARVVSAPAPGGSTAGGAAIPPSAATAVAAAAAAAAALPVQDPNAAGGANYRPLNVRDALSYLDQVKVQFYDDPDVYNRFLDVMKEFKGQIIDTPGVIDRVSSLFRGHPSLIQGFNTFLPPGYRIECLGGEGDERGLITVITPTGTVSQIAGQFSAGLAAVAASAAAAQGGPGGQPGGQQQQQQGQPGPSGWQQHPQQQPPPGYGQPPNQQQQPSNPQQPGLPNNLPPVPMPSQPSHLGPPSGPGTPIAAHALTPSQQQQLAARGPLVEFNHAINYVNKIKNRFINDGDTYKQFLEILQTYQKDQRPIQDVYAQVTILFKNAPDLLDEFKQFLPDTSNGAPPTGGLFGGIISQMTGIPNQEIQNAQNAERNASKASESSRAAAADKGKRSEKSAKSEGKAGKEVEVPSSKKKRGVPGEKEKTATSSSKPKKSKHHHKADSPPLDDYSQHPSHQQHQQQQQQMQQHQQQQQQLQHQPSYSAAHNSGGSLATPDEIAFFEKVKKHIEDKNAYHEFLKLLNLFTQDIIDSKVLVDRASLFIGNSGELWNQFRVLVGDDQAAGRGGGGPGAQYGLNGSGGVMGAGAGLDGVLENSPAVDRPKVDLNSCKAYGASYRKLPKSEVNLACSGRDPMCWDVLNDEWVSHPTSASEDAAPFIAHKKNIYEEALHRAEEERHEYDYHIEANLRTIQLLEPIAARIAVMSAEEKAGFRLKPGLGGQSKSIYQRIIKKIYGREGGLEVISALHDNPTIAVPVVLARLKQKDEEWKRAQREWNKVWREVDAKNFYKSLDHQGVTFKANDKKAIATKSLVAEIEALRREQNHRRETALDASLAVKPKYQYSYRIDDVDCLADSLKMVLSYLDRGPGGMSLTERDRVETFLRTFIPTLFMFSKADFDAALGEVADVPGGFGAENGEADDGESEGGDENGRGKKSAGDLRKKVLKGGVTTNGKGRAGSATPSNASTSAAPSPAIGEAGPSTGANDWMNDLTPIAGNGDGTSAPVEDANSMDVDSAPAPSTSNVRGGEEGAEKTWINLDDFGGSEYGNSRASSPVGSNYGGEDGGRTGGSRRSTRKANFFANTPLYVLIRLLQMLYNRLNTLKTIGQALSTHNTQLINPLAISLGMNDVGGPSPLLMEGINPSSRFYEYSLDLVEKLFDNEMDQATYEENMRHMFGTKAYITFTLDKLIAGIVKQVQVVMADPKSHDLLNLLANDRTLDSTSARQQISYRMNAEGILGSDENLYRIEWVEDTKSLLVQLLGKDDLTLDDAITAEQKWKAYLSSFILTHPTEGLPARVKQPFLRRSMHPLPAGIASAQSQEPSQAFIADSGLEIKVCIGSYKLFFVPETEDFFARRLTAEEEEQRKAGAERKGREGRERLERFADERLAVVMGSQADVDGKGKGREVVEENGNGEAKAEEPVTIAAPSAAA